MTSVNFSHDEMDEYDAHVKQLQKKWIIETKLKSKELSLMENTFQIRKKWILDNEPSVSEILEKFPALKKPKSFFFLFLGGRVYQITTECYFININLIETGAQIEIES